MLEVCQIKGKEAIDLNDGDLILLSWIDDFIGAFYNV